MRWKAHADIPNPELQLQFCGSLHCKHLQAYPLGIPSALCSRVSQGLVPPSPFQAAEPYPWVNSQINSILEHRLKY